MPQIPVLAQSGIDKNALRVLITGFGPFSRYSENPSWLAVKPLQNVVLQAENEPEPVTVDGTQVIADGTARPHPRPIHITALYVPVTYDFVLSRIPGLHARPPVLPPAEDEPGLFAVPPPPTDGYDLVLHVGAGLRGNMRVEKLAHKLGYAVPDVDGKLPPIVVTHAPGGGEAGRDEAERFERERAGLADGEEEEVIRGFAKGYEPFAEELSTDVDVEGVVQRLKELGIDQIQPSSNAGRYLCDFIFYCSLSESLRTRQRYSGGPGFKPTKVLFVHCPPVGEPLGTQYVTNALERIILKVCGQDL